MEIVFAVLSILSLSGKVMRTGRARMRSNECDGMEPKLNHLALLVICVANFLSLV